MNIITAVSQYESCKLWIDGFRSDSTKRAYSVHVSHVSLFCKFHYTNLDESVKIKPDELKRMIINYILELKKRVKNIVGKPKRGSTSIWCLTLKRIVPS